MVIPRGDAVALARALIQIDSRNPTLAPGSPGEGECASVLASVLDEWGFDVQLMEAVPGRPNLVARLGETGGSTLMLTGHLDVVAVDGMTHEPFSAELRNDRIYGRGSADMKAGIAAMCAAATILPRKKGKQVLIAAVVDEEYESLGTRALLASGIRADAAIVTEPTRLAICPAHRGFAWFDVELEGRAAHGSRYDIGVDAIMHAGLLLAELDRLETQRILGPTHALLGRGSLHASTISGGTGLSTYPESCSLTIERRTIPGESVEDAVTEITEACARVKFGRPQFEASVKLRTAQLPSDVPLEAPIVRCLVAAMQREGVPVKIEGLSAWTDAALLNEAGIPAVCFGPGDISLAHAAEEFVPVNEIERAAGVLRAVIRDWCEAL